MMFFFVIYNTGQLLPEQIDFFKLPIKIRNTCRPMLKYIMFTELNMALAHL